MLDVLIQWNEAYSRNVEFFLLTLLELELEKKTPSLVEQDELAKLLIEGE